jgi:predicted unusual protein kinase regulating ubiquinone biosynthesis (AarF/ABC1/UbiB family)
MHPPPVRPVTLPEPSRREIAARVGLGVRSAGRHLVAARRRGPLDRAAVAGVVRRVFEDLGGTFTKFGQLVASAPSLFGDDVAGEFRGCLDAGPAVPYADVAAAVASELGQPIDVAFASFERTPVAAASLAVVHRAELPDGTPVAVKVLRPGIEQRVATDLAVLGPVCNFVARQIAVGIAGTLHGLVEGLREQLREELDIRNEADAARWFMGILDAVDAPDVRVPEPVASRSGARVLTMSLLDGVPIDDDVAIAALGIEIEPLVRSCLRTWFVSTLASGAFHGDIHAGNVLVSANGTIALLDWGIVGRLEAETAHFFRRMLEGALGDDAAWVDVAAHIEKTYGSGMRDLLGFDDAAFVEFIRSQIEPVLVTPFGQVDLRTMLIGDGAVDGKRAGSRTKREAIANWWAERKRQQAFMAMEGYGGDFDRVQFLLAKQLVYFERYGKKYLPDVPLIDDPTAFRALLARTAPPVPA